MPLVEKNSPTRTAGFRPVPASERRIRHVERILNGDFSRTLYRQIEEFFAPRAFRFHKR